MVGMLQLDDHTGLQYRRLSIPTTGLEIRQMAIVTVVAYADPMLTLILLACATTHHPDPVVRSFTIEDVPPLLAATAGFVDALPDSTPAACITTESVSSALRAAATVVKAEGLLLPAIIVDASGCGSMPPGVNVPKEIEAVLAVLPIATAITVPQVDCRAKVWLQASVNYAGGVAPAVIDEISSPDGNINIPAVAVDLSSCQ